MTVLLTLLLTLLFAPGVFPDLTPQERDPSATTLVMPLDDYVTHFVSISLLLNECGEDWELFKKKRDNYLLHNGITGDDLLLFLTSHEEEPEYWLELWEKIYETLPEDEKRPPGKQK